MIQINFANYIFQSTHPRGVRLHKGRTMFLRRRYFNPRTREGCDHQERDREDYIEEFQSTHPRGVRRIICPNGRKSNGFQSTHPRGVRHRSECRFRYGYGISIHAPARGATEGQRGRDPATEDFNPRTREGCDEVRTHLGM